MTRYTQLIGLVHGLRPSRILEVGTWEGGTAEALARAALEHKPRVHYVGFDLFEKMPEAQREAELHVKPTAQEAEVRRRLASLASETAYGFTYELVVGDTRQTLPKWVHEHPNDKADLIFLDGGHSVETIQSDLRACQKALAPGGTLVMDDFYDAEDALIAKWGCNLPLEQSGLRYQVLPGEDPFYVQEDGKPILAGSVHLAIVF